jgi:hypothetical protein
MSAHESKPEWFQLADEDWASNPRAISAKEVKARRKNPIRLMAISTPLLVLGAGLFVAQSQEAPQAFAASAPIVATAPMTATAPVSEATTTTTVPTTSSPVVESAPVTSYQASVVTTPKISSSASTNALSTLQSGLILPAQGTVQSGDDGDDHGDDGDDEGQDD